MCLKIEVTGHRETGWEARGVIVDSWVQGEVTVGELGTSSLDVTKDGAVSFEGRRTSPRWERSLSGEEGKWVDY